MQNIWLIMVGLVIGAVVAAFPARTVKMTAMPQMVAIFNGMGGATAALVSLVEFQHKADIGRGEIVSIVLGMIIGSISFTGSMVAFVKLQELISGRADLVSRSSSRSTPSSASRVVALGGASSSLLGQASRQATADRLLFLAALVLGALSCCRSAAPTCRWSSPSSTR